jgi:hypothetical protein
MNGHLELFISQSAGLEDFQKALIFFFSLSPDPPLLCARTDGGGGDQPLVGMACACTRLAGLLADLRARSLRAARPGVGVWRQPCCADEQRRTDAICCRSAVHGADKHQHWVSEQQQRQQKKKGRKLLVVLTLSLACNHAHTHTQKVQTKCSPRRTRTACPGRRARRV